VSKLQRRRQERFGTLFSDAYEDVLRFAQRRVYPSQAEDVAAETFLVAWRRLDDVPHGSSDARAWLFGVARQCVLNTNRGRQRQEALAVRISETAPWPLREELDADLVVQHCDLAAAWRRLSPAEQEVLALAVFDDLTSAQAARVVQISASAYRLRLMRARRALRRHLLPPEVSIFTDPMISEATS